MRCVTISWIRCLFLQHLEDLCKVFQQLLNQLSQSHSEHQNLKSVADGRSEERQCVVFCVTSLP